MNNSSGDVWDDFFASTRGTELEYEEEDDVDDVDFDSMDDEDE